MTNWIALIDLPPDTDGVSGGKEPWSLRVIRVASNPESLHWWEVNGDQPSSGLTIFRDEKNEICRVDLVSNLPFEDAARVHGLDTRVFGSPTLWPLIHRPVTQAGRSTGWLWTFSEEEPFPFI